MTLYFHNAKQDMDFLQHCFPEAAVIDTRGTMVRVYETMDDYVTEGRPEVVDYGKGWERE